MFINIYKMYGFFSNICNYGSFHFFENIQDKIKCYIVYNEVFCTAQMTQIGLQCGTIKCSVGHCLSPRSSLHPLCFQASAPPAPCHTPYAHTATNRILSYRERIVTASFPLGTMTHAPPSNLTLATPRHLRLNPGYPEMAFLEDQPGTSGHPSYSDL